MKGVVFDGMAAVVTDKLTVRDPGPSEVRVRMMAAGLCHSDVSVVNGTIPWPAPSVLGHEGAGIVSAIGSAVTTVAVGDHVILSTLASCGACRKCSMGQPWRCYRSMGNRIEPFTYDGQACGNFAATSCFAEETIIGERQAIKIPNDIPFASAALVGCGVITGAGAVFNRSDVQIGDTAVVFGVGGVGLNTIQALRVKRASRIIAIDTLASKEALARQFGATDFIDASTTTDVVTAVREMLPFSDDQMVGPMNAGGADWVYDVVAHPSVTRSAVEMLDWGGNLVIIGVPAPTVEMTQLYARLTHIERSITGTRAGSYVPQRDFPMILDLYRKGEFLLDELVTRQYPLESFHDAVHDMHEGKLARGVLTFA